VGTCRGPHLRGGATAASTRRSRTSRAFSSDPTISHDGAILSPHERSMCCIGCASLHSLWVGRTTSSPNTTSFRHMVCRQRTPSPTRTVKGPTGNSACCADVVAGWTCCENVDRCLDSFRTGYGRDKASIGPCHSDEKWPRSCLSNLHTTVCGDIMYTHLCARWRIRWGSGRTSCSRAFCA
jgi:hypothetical protein